ncbi:MAG: M13 family metallopeptidase [Caldimonas sp.]
MKNRLTRQAFALAAMLALTHSAMAAENTAAVPISGIDQATFDAGVRPQDDLFLHVNGTWIKQTDFPKDKSYIGALDSMQDETELQLRGLIEAAAAGTGDAEGRKIGDLYASFMDEARLETLGVKPLAAELKAIDAISDGAQLAAELAHLDRLGAGVPLTVVIGQDDRDSTRYIAALVQAGLGLPDRDYYLKTEDATFAAVRAKYLDYLANLLTLAGGKDTHASAESVLALETDIARLQWTLVENRDPVKAYNKYEIAALPKLAPAFAWAEFMSTAGLTGPRLEVDKVADVLVSQPSYVAGLGSLTQSAPLAAWKAYAKTHLLGAYARYLDKAFVDARFAFNGTVLQGTPANPPRWRRGVSLVDQSIGESLGHLYVKAYFPPEYKARIEALVGNLIVAYRQSIGTLDWMDPETKKAAYAKLDKIALKVGYPSTFRDYGALVIARDDLVGNVQRAREFEYRRNLAKLGQPIDRGEWGMTPQTINAYYDLSMNEIVFPAAILQAPRFDPKADDAANYGAIGATIGHELSHAFDDQGSQYDADGNLRVWWTPADRARFDAKTKILVAQYSAFVPVPGYPVNGELTLGENIADNSGLEIAYKAYQLSLGGQPAPVIDGMSGDQRFFYGFAQSWRSKQRPQAMLEQIKSDPHSPDAVRVDATVRNHPAFYATFGVKPGDAMYLPPEQRVSIW